MRLVLSLHGFSDGSGKAYAAVVYLRVTFSSRYVVSRFVASKTQVNSIKSLIITRLGLMSCLILSRLVKTVMDSFVDFAINKLVCWSDSMDCICWINTRSKVWNRFVHPKSGSTPQRVTR